MARSPRGMNHYSDSELATRLSSILLNAAEGRRSLADDRQYAEIRKALDRRNVGLPRQISLHPTMDSFGAFLKEMPDREARAEFVRDEIGPLLRTLENAEVHSVDHSTWTGIHSPVEQVRAVKALLPVARASIE